MFKPQELCVAWLEKRKTKRGIISSQKREKRGLWGWTGTWEIPPSFLSLWPATIALALSFEDWKLVLKLVIWLHTCWISPSFHFSDTEVLLNSRISGSGDQKEDKPGKEVVPFIREPEKEEVLAQKLPEKGWWKSDPSAELPSERYIISTADLFSRWSSVLCLLPLPAVKYQLYSCSVTFSPLPLFLLLGDWENKGQLKGNFSSEVWHTVAA